MGTLCGCGVQVAAAGMGASRGLATVSALLEAGASIRATTNPEGQVAVYQTGSDAVAVAVM